jgi:hypothetical protein
MKKFTIALLIGLTAGIIDVVPMFFMHLNWYANISALLHWCVLGIIIPFVKWNVKPWLKGVIIATISAFPVIVITLEEDYSSVLPILFSSVILGALTGIVSNKLIS